LYRIGGALRAGKTVDLFISAYSKKNPKQNNADVMLCPRVLSMCAEREQLIHQAWASPDFSDTGSAMVGLAEILFSFAARKAMSRYSQK
jgi:hypothetical protein